MLKIVTLVALVATCALWAVAGHADVAGTASVIDGDTLDVRGVRVRLHAIDAPEGKQTCSRGGVTWLCGQEAAKALRGLLRGHTVDCEERDRDRYGRVVAVCRAGSVDIGREMVAMGLALAYRQFGTAYVRDEEAARASQRGLWAGTFVPPWDFRKTGNAGAPAASQPAPRPAAAPAACAIKGNITRSGRIYHVPGSRSYAATKVDTSRGERWFCTEAEARAAGWRAPRG